MSIPFKLIGLHRRIVFADLSYSTITNHDALDRFHAIFTNLSSRHVSDRYENVIVVFESGDAR